MSLDCASPEQVKGQAITKATDVYSLGVLLYELLTGVSPQGGPGRAMDETIRRICHETPERPSTLRPGISSELDSIVLRAMRKDPQLRYASAQELSADIGRILEGVPVVASKETFLCVVRRFAARHNLAAAVVCAVVLMAAAVALWDALVASR